MKSINSKLFTKSKIENNQLSQVKGGIAASIDMFAADTNMFNDINPTKSRHTGDCSDSGQTGWSCDATSKCSDR